MVVYKTDGKKVYYPGKFCWADIECSYFYIELKRKDFVYRWHVEINDDYAVRLIK